MNNLRVTTRIFFSRAVVCILRFSDSMMCVYVITNTQYQGLRMEQNFDILRCIAKSAVRVTLTLCAWQEWELTHRNCGPNFHAVFQCFQWLSVPRHL